MYMSSNVVHRNAAGRTGVFCTVHACVDQVKEEQGVDVLQNVKLQRIHRTNMVDTKVSTVKNGWKMVKGG